MVAPDVSREDLSQRQVPHSMAYSNYLREGGLVKASWGPLSIYQGFLTFFVLGTHCSYM